MAGPPSMRSPMGTPMGSSMMGAPPGAPPAMPPPQQQQQQQQGGGAAPGMSPVSPPPQVASAVSSKRRAYPTAHLAANSVSFSGGFDPGALSGGATPSPAAAGAPQPQSNGSQFFTPAGPAMGGAGLQPPQQQQQQHQQQQQQQQHTYGHQHHPSAAAAPSGFSAAQNGMAGAAGGFGMNNLAGQFQNMGMGGAKGVCAGTRGEVSRPIDSSNMPLADSLLLISTSSPQNPLLTVNLSGMMPDVNGLERPPPEIRLPPNACISTNPKANADPSYQRCTLNAVPTTSSLLAKSRLPLGLVLSPYRSVREEDGDEPVPVVTDTVIARCRRCRTYINPYVQFIEGGTRWKCCMCNISNEVPQLFDWDQETNQPADRWQRPELNHSVVEFVAPREYMVRTAFLI